MHPKIFSYSNSQNLINFREKLKGFTIGSNDKLVAYLLYSENVSSKRNDELWVYLEYIGVHPDFQNSGFGQTLITSFTKMLDQKQLPSYLYIEEETQNTDKLVKWYQKHLYQIAQRHAKDDSESIYIMRMIRYPTK